MASRSSGSGKGCREARIRSNIADVYGVICGELASPSSGLNSAISGKENSLIKLAQLFRLLSLSLFPFFPFLYQRHRSFVLSFLLSLALVRLHSYLRSSPLGTSGVAAGRRGGGETADSDVTRLDSFSSLGSEGQIIRGAGHGKGAPGTAGGACRRRTHTHTRARYSRPPPPPFLPSFPLAHTYSRTHGG